MKSKFIPPNNDHSYYPLLFKALEETKGDVLELGTGWGSTPLLNEYCKVNKRNLTSYDEKPEWLNKFLHYEDVIKNKLEDVYHHLRLTTNWREVYPLHKDNDVIFIDHAPGEDRKQMILDFKDSKGILVCHDTEPAADHGYQMRQHWGLFKYVTEVKTNGAWATAMSNTIDVTKWNGEIFGEYKIG